MVRDGTELDPAHLGPEAVERYLRRFRLGARKSLSQNHLADGLVLERIIETAAVSPGERIVEVGPGVGILTAQLLAAGALVTAVELDDRLAEHLRQRFADEPSSTLLGTVSLWQGVDVPGASCILVVIDRIPFPRPDDPLLSARQRAVDEAGGSGFRSVSVPKAGLLLAQGAGRLIRGTTDRGVVAVLDSRLATAGYSSALRASLPPFWYTTDRATVLGSLARLRDELGSGDQPAPDQATTDQSFENS